LEEETAFRAFAALGTLVHGNETCKEMASAFGLKAHLQGEMANKNHSQRVKALLSQVVRVC
jgi:hypothetical protein